MVDKQRSRQLVVQRETEITMNICYRSWKWKEFEIHNHMILHVPKNMITFSDLSCKLLRLFRIWLKRWAGNVWPFLLQCVCKNKKRMWYCFCYNIKYKWENHLVTTIIIFYLQVLQTSILTITRRTYEFFSTNSLFVLLKLTRSWKNGILWIANIACKSSMGMNLKHEYL